MPKEEGFSIADIIRNSMIPREMVPVFEKLRREAFDMAEEVYVDRTVGYNVDHPCYEEQIYGPISLASEVYKRSKRLAALLSPLRENNLRSADVNRTLDACIDTINYLTWTYALLKLSTGYLGHKNSDDSPDYNNTGEQHG